MLLPDVMTTSVIAAVATALGQSSSDSIRPLLPPDSTLSLPEDLNRALMDCFTLRALLERCPLFEDGESGLDDESMRAYSDPNITVRRCLAASAAGGGGGVCSAFLPFGVLVKEEFFFVDADSPSSSTSKLKLSMLFISVSPHKKLAEVPSFCLSLL